MATCALTPEMRQFLLGRTPAKGSLVPGRQTSGRWVGLITDGRGGDEAWRAQDRHPSAPTAAPA